MEHSIIDITRSTADNMKEFLLQLAAHIERLETENAELRRALGNKDNVTE
jgi:uncharacterized protein (UPF0335 family)